MAGNLKKVVGCIRAITAFGDGEAGSDGALLQRYATQQDEGAFAELVRRHGALVLATCKRVLHDLHEVEDAFQATFIVLARRARGLRVQGALGGWLHGVAYRVALRARANAARRRSRQKEDAMEVPAAASSDHSWQELCPILDEELQRLPRKFRDPIVLCYLQGKTYDEASRELGWPRSSMGDWIVRARELLRKRLERRGVTLSGVALTATIAEQSVTAAVPAVLSDQAVRSAMAVAMGAPGFVGIVSENASALAESMLQSLAAARVRFLVAVVLFVSLFLSGAGLLAFQLLSAQRNPPRVRELRHDDVVRCLAFGPRGDLLATMCEDGTITFWNCFTGEELRRCNRVPNPPIKAQCQLCFSPDGRLLAATAANEDISLWETQTGNLQGRVGFVSANPILAFAPAGGQIATVSSDPGSIGIWDIATAKQVDLLDVGATRIAHVAFSPKGGRLAACAGSTLSVWDFAARQCVASIEMKKANFASAVFNGDGMRLATLGMHEDAEPIRLWDAATLHELRRLDHANANFHALALSADGLLLAAAAGDDGSAHAVHLWNLVTGHKLGLLHEGTEPFWSVAFSPDGTWLASGGDNNIVRVWSVAGLPR